MNRLKVLRTACLAASALYLLAPDPLLAVHKSRVGVSAQVDGETFTGFVTKLDPDRVTIASDREVDDHTPEGTELDFPLGPQTKVDGGELRVGQHVVVLYRRRGEARETERVVLLGRDRYLGETPRPPAAAPPSGRVVDAPRPPAAEPPSGRVLDAPRRPGTSDPRQAAPALLPRGREPATPEPAAPRAERRLGGGDPPPIRDEWSRRDRDAARKSLAEYRAHASAGRADAALAKLDEAIRLDPLWVDPYYTRGALHGGAERYPQALADYEKAIELSPSAPGAYNNVVRIHLLTGEWDKAFVAVDRALTTHARNPHGYVMRGILLLRMARPRDADADFAYGERLEPGVRDKYAREIDEARRAAPKAPQPRASAQGKSVNDAALLLVRERDRAAADLLDALVARNSKDAEAFLLRAKAHYNLKQFAMALEDVQQSLKLDPKSAEAYRMLGRCHEAWGRGDEAIEAYGKAIALDPEGAMAYIDRGVATMQYRPNLQATALRDIDMALKVDPANPYAWYNKAGFYPVDLRKPTPDWDFMIRHYSEAIRLKPDFAGAYAARGVAYLGKNAERNQPQLQALGEKDIRTAVSLRPQLQATIQAMVDDLKNIPATAAYVKQMLEAMWDGTPPRRSEAGDDDPCSGARGGSANACRARDYMAYDRYKGGTATGSDKKKYGGY